MGGIPGAKDFQTFTCLIITHPVYYIRIFGINTMLGTRIRDIRNARGLTQEEFADRIGLGRTQVVAIESGKRSIKAEELQSIGRILGVSCDALLDEERGVQVVIESAKTAEQSVPSMRIDVPRKNLEKFRQVLLFILNRVGSQPNVGETVIYKLLYFIDFDFYERYEEQLIGATYRRNHYGPTPLEFQAIVDRMISEGDIEKVNSEYFSYPQTKYLPRCSPDLSKFDGREVAMIEEVLDRLGDMSASRISEYSHDDVPWLTTEPGEVIGYEKVFYRTPAYSARLDERA